MRERNGGGCERPRPFRVIAIRAGFVLAKYRGKYRYKRSSQPLRWSCFGGAAVASLNKGKVNLFVLGKFCRVAKVVQCFRMRIAIARGQSDALDGRGIFGLGGH